MRRLLTSVSTWKDVSTGAAPALRVDRPDAASAINTFRGGLPTFKGGIPAQVLVVGFTNDLASGTRETLTLSRAAESAQFDATQLAKRTFLFVDLRQLLRVGELVPPSPDTPFGMAEFAVSAVPVVEGTSVTVTAEDAVTEEIGGDVVNIHLRAVVEGDTSPTWVSLAQLTPSRAVIVPLAAIMELLAAPGERPVFRTADMERKLVARCTFAWQWWRETAATALNVAAKNAGVVTSSALSAACDTADLVCWIALAFKAPAALRAHVFALVCPHFTWRSKSKHASGVPVAMRDIVKRMGEEEQKDASFSAEGGGACTCTPEGKTKKRLELEREVLSIGDAGGGTSHADTGDHGEREGVCKIVLSPTSDMAPAGQAFIGCEAKGVFGTEEAAFDDGNPAIRMYGGPFTLASADPVVAAGACCAFVQLMTTTFGKVSATKWSTLTAQVVTQLPDGADLLLESDKAVVSARRFLRKHLPAEVERVAFLRRPVMVEELGGAWNAVEASGPLAARATAACEVRGTPALPWMFAHFPGFEWAVAKVAADARVPGAPSIGCALALRFPDIHVVSTDAFQSAPPETRRMTLGALAAKLTWTPRELVSRLGALDCALGTASPWRWWLRGRLPGDGICAACAPRDRVHTSAWAFAFANDASGKSALWALRAEDGIDSVVGPSDAVSIPTSRTEETFSAGVDTRSGFGPFAFIAVKSGVDQCVAMMKEEGFTVAFNMCFNADVGVWSPPSPGSTNGWHYLVFSRA